ncbi:MAG: hypothetical protein KC776_27820 [Myxococcales bacterium]|nr:hypothetical protein [Myxococcales bacterium]MCB9577628.1 hypothetical protein [Polyangiaceae bacterium]
MSRVLRTIALSLLVIVLALAALTARAMLEGRRELAESDAAFDQGDLHGATEHARRAAVLYAPGAPHVPKAYARLTAIAVGAEAAGDRREAESAWRAIRGAALETRHLWIPERAHLARANEALARLAVSEGDRSTAGDRKAALERARAELGRDDAPGAPWLIALVLGFVSALLGLGLVALRGVTPDGRIVIGRAKLGLALALLGAACWTVAVWKA